MILACWAVSIWRIKAEERILSEDARYRELLQQTRFRLIPGVY